MSGLHVWQKYIYQVKPWSSNIDIGLAWNIGQSVKAYNNDELIVDVF